MTNPRNPRHLDSIEGRRNNATDSLEDITNDQIRYELLKAFSKPFCKIFGVRPCIGMGGGTIMGSPCPLRQNSEPRK